jgi:hypothetical protein
MERLLQDLSIEHRKKLSPLEKTLLTEKHAVNKGYFFNVSNNCRLESLRLKAQAYKLRVLLNFKLRSKHTCTLKFLCRPTFQTVDSCSAICIPAAEDL